MQMSKHVCVVNCLKKLALEIEWNPNEFRGKMAFWGANSSMNLGRKMACPSLVKQILYLIALILHWEVIQLIEFNVIRWLFLLTWFIATQYSYRASGALQFDRGTQCQFSENICSEDELNWDLEFS